MSAGENSNIRGFSWQYGVSSPEQIRTAVSALRGRRPRPLDDGAGVRSGGGLEPPTTGPEPAVLPITPPPKVS